MSRRTAGIALGSNLGDREGQLARAMVSLEKAPGLTVLRRSHWIETQPVGGPAGQGPYLNGAALLETELDARQLLTLLQGIEAKYGRRRELETERNQPRTLDLDLLFLGEVTLGEPDLTLPHPRMEERLFVLEPLGELCPERLLPSGLTVAQRLAALRAQTSPAEPEAAS